jgi:hypothetical protein
MCQVAASRLWGDVRRGCVGKGQSLTVQPNKSASFHLALVEIVAGLGEPVAIGSWVCADDLGGDQAAYVIEANTQASETVHCPLTWTTFTEEVLPVSRTARRHVVASWRSIRRVDKS